MRHTLRRALAVVATATALLAATAPPATAETAVNQCGSYVADYGSVQIWGCYEAQGGSPTGTIRPYAKVTFRNVNPSQWDECYVRVALFIDNVQRTLHEYGCLAWALTGRQDSPATGTFGEHTFKAEAGPKYRAVVRWFGTYAGNPVGSHVNAESPTVSFGRLVHSDAVDLHPDLPLVPIPTPVPPLPVEYAI